MKKWKRFILAATLVLALLLSGCSELGGKSGKESPPPEFDVYLQLGDTFEYYPDRATGKLLCTVTNARVVTEESECPPYDWFVAYKLTAVIDGKEVYYRYPDFFVEGGAFDRGCRIILVDVTLENVDAMGLPKDQGGSFNSPYAFYASFVCSMGNKSILIPAPDDLPSMYLQNGPMCFSQANQYTEGEYTDPCAIEILPGETVTYTLGFPVHTKSDGSPQDLSVFYLQCTKVGEEYMGEYGLAKDRAHIELGLGAE